MDEKTSGSLVGQVLGRYRVLSQLGQGGMATVYRAFDPDLKRDVVVKVILQRAAPDEQLVKRFRLEAKTLAQLAHPHIVRILDYGEANGRPYLVMEYIRGGTLKDRLGQAMPWRDAAALLAPIAWALAYAHSQGIIHRDVKPANILLNEAGTPLLSDFGIAKIVRPGATTGLTGTGLSMGTPAYIAPEQGLGKLIDHRADIYTLGLIFYELVTGVKPFDADTPMALVIKHIQEAPPRPRTLVPALPDPVERVLLKALAKQPDDRFQSMGDFAALLDRMAEGRAIGRAEAPGAGGPRTLRGPLWAVLGSGAFGLAALSLCVLAGLFYAFVLRRPAATPEIPNGYVYVAAVKGEATLAARDGSSSRVRRGAVFPGGPGTVLHTGAGQVELGLTDGTSVYVGPDSDLELTQVADPGIAVTATLLTLQRGAALAVVVLSPEFVFALDGPAGEEAEIVEGTLGVTYNPDPQRLDADCLAGACGLGLGEASLILGPGEHGWFEHGAGPFGPDSARVDVWSFTGLALAASPEAQAAKTLVVTTAAPDTATATATASNTATPTRPGPAATQPPAPTATHRPPTAAPQPTAAPPTAPPPTNTAPPPPPPPTNTAPPPPPPPSNTAPPPPPPSNTPPPPPTNTAPPPPTDTPVPTFPPPTVPPTALPTPTLAP